MGRDRRRSGFLLPGIFLTVLTCLGVVALIASATGVLPDEVPILRAAGGKQRRAVVATAPASPSRTAPPRASAPPPATTAPPAGPTARPTRTASGGGGPTAGPTAKATTAPTTAPPAPACKAGSATVTAVADAYVDQNSPATNYGNAATNLVTSRNKGRNRRTLVRFALPAVPKGCTVTGGTLKVTAREATGRRIVASRASRAWDEGAVTWANAPGASGSGVSATVSSKSVAWTLSPAMLTAYGFVLADGTENAGGAGEQTGFVARTGSAPPTLTVRWA